MPNDMVAKACVFVRSSSILSQNYRRIEVIFTDLAVIETDRPTASPSKVGFSTRRLLERTAENSFHRRTPSVAPATNVTPGSAYPRMSRDQPSRNSARGLCDAARHALPLTLGGRAQDHRDPLVGAAVLWADSIGKTERTWKTLSRRSDAAPFIPASRPKRGWSRTSIPSTPSARRARRSRQ
jgi:hypothetical protein